MLMFIMQLFWVNQESFVTQYYEKKEFSSILVLPDLLDLTPCLIFLYFCNNQPTSGVETYS